MARKQVSVFGARLGVMLVIMAMAMATAMFATAAGARTRQSGNGTLVIGAEQEPDCLDWIGSCSGSSWGFWMVNVNTIPRAMDPVKVKGGWGWKHNSMLKSEPKLVTSPKQVVTYTINPKAVWNDGTPITSSDFKYTWDQIAHGTDVYDQTGYKQIESVDDSNPSVAVVTFSTPFAPWKQLFAGQYGLMPSHILQGKDRDTEMKDGYKFSGGPWVLQSWDKGASITLVPNDKFWGTKPTIKKLVFKFTPETSAEFQAYKGGEVSMIYPQPQTDVVDQIKAGGLPAGGKVYNSRTGNSEGLWINNSKAPFDNVKVRQAVAYSLDRAALVKRLFGPLGVKSPLQSFNSPIVSQYGTQSFSKYTPNLSKVRSLMKGAGYTKKNGVWTKGGKTAEFSIKTTQGNDRRQLSVEIIQSQLKKAGFKADLVYVKAGDLFGEQLPAGDFDMALYAQVLTAPEPTLCTLFCSENIPSDANQNSGQNWTHTDVKGLDKQLTTVDTDLSNKARVVAGRAADVLIANSVTSLPIDPLPNILLWNKSVTGKINDQPVLGPFWNANTWKLKG